LPNFIRQVKLFSVHPELIFYWVNKFDEMNCPANFNNNIYRMSVCDMIN
jgi:hypothetical protein